MNDNITQLTDDSFESVVIKNRELPVLVDFWAEWCGPCKAMTPIIDEIATEYHGRLIVAKFNIDENNETASRYHIRSIPTLLLFKNGSVMATKIGALSIRELKKFLEDML